MNSADLINFGLLISVGIWFFGVWAAWELFNMPSPKPPAAYTGPVPERWVVEEYIREIDGYRLRYCFNYSDGTHESVTCKWPQGAKGLMLTFDGQVQGWWR